MSKNKFFKFKIPFLSRAKKSKNKSKTDRKKFSFNLFKLNLFKNKKFKRAFLYTILGIVIILVGAIAWISKDLPTPGKIKAIRSAESTQIFDRNGNLLYAVYGDQKRISIASDQIPDNVKNATIATEDRSFYKHFGVDFKGIARAVYYDITNKKRAQGGSTITQQYVKNAMLTPNRTFTRKIKEAILSVELEIIYSKDQILTMYLNEIPYGSNAYGIQAAAKTYFNKDAKDLTLPEAATLAALPKAPTYYSPYGGHTDELMGRKDYVLDSMADTKYITRDQANEAKQIKIVFQKNTESIQSPHFVMYVKEVLAEKYGDQMVETGGLKVTTTLDPDKQKIAQQVISDAAPTLKSYNASNAGLVSIDPKTGEILAMVGSINYFDMEHDGNFNVTISNRSPGSSFKPVVYATAFKGQWSPASTLFDLKTDFGSGYSPDNFDNKSRGPVSIRTALSNSLNVPAVKMLDVAGMNNVLSTAHDMGITTLTDPGRFGLTVAIGGGETKLLEMTGAYSVFANQGLKYEVTPILKVEDHSGKVLEERKDVKGNQVLDPQIAYEISNILSDNAARTPVFGARSALYFPNRNVAVKTGTSESYRDAQTVGYTPSLATGVWVGNNNNTVLTHAGGVMAAAPIFHSYMEKALANTPNEDFAKPDGIQTMTVDALTGKKPGSTAPLGLRTDIVSSWQAPKDSANIYTTTKIDMLCGDKLATDQTPANMIQEKTFANVHSEMPNKPNWENPVRAWAQAAGLGSIAPTQNCDLRNPQNKPSISITSPHDSQNVSGSFAITVNINAPLGVTRVEYFADNVSIGTSSSSPYSLTYDMNNLSNGLHDLMARVVDRGDYTATNTKVVNVTQDSSPPGNVSNVSKTGGAGIVNLSWTNPSDSDFSKVRIYYSTTSGSLGTKYPTEVSGSHNGTSSITISLPSNTYYFTLRPVDSSGNENQSTNQYSISI